MIKNTVQRDAKRVIIYYTFDDEPAGSIQHSASGNQAAASAPQPSAHSPQPSERSDNE